MSILGLGRPQRGPLSQTQFGSTSPCLLLLASQPIAQRWNEIVVGQLVELGTWIAGGIRLKACWVGRCDEPQLSIEDAEKIVELTRTTFIARSCQQFCMRPHMAFDVRANLGQESLEDGARSDLMQSV